MVKTMSLYDFEPRHKSVAQHITSGVFSSGVMQLIKIVVQFGSVIILSRLLLPSDFGMVAKVAPICGIAALFLDIGLSQVTVQKDNLRHEEANAFFWINVAVSMFLMLILIALSPVVGWFYNDPRVIPLTIAMALLILLGGMGNQHGAILRRRMEFKTLAVIDIMGTFGALFSSILFAVIYKSYWALFAGVVAGTFIPVAGVWIATKWKPSYPKSVQGIRSMLKFGAGISCYNISIYFSRNIDNLLIGHRWGDRSLGLYDRAYKLLLFPLTRVIDPIGGSLIPLLSRLKTDSESYRGIILSSIEQISLLVWPGIICAIVYVDDLVPLFLGKNWEGVEMIFLPLAVAAMLQSINTAGNWVFISLGRSTDYGKWGIFVATTSVASFVIGLPYGASGVATAYAISEVIRTPLLWAYATSKGPIKWQDVMGTLLPQCAGVAITLFVLYMYHYFVQFSPIINLGVGAVVAYTLHISTVAFFPRGRRSLRRTLNLVCHLIHSIKAKR